ncbi:MAG: stage 0 sporulation family protein [Chlorobi bacterium]|nr:stage 0 sporulation family protein [Chlorobiota bacterium]
MTDKDSSHSNKPPSDHSLDDSILIYSSEAPVSGCGGTSPPCALESGDIPEDPWKDITPDDVVEVEFKAGRKDYFLNVEHLELSIGDYLVTEADRGIDLGRLIDIGQLAYHKVRLRNKGCVANIKRVIRLGTEEDLKILRYHREQEHVAFEICKEKIENHGLPMKLVDVEYQLDRNRITFYFTADGRVDFRELVKDLAAEYRTRIELRQIGARDEAKRHGGFGSCGRELCCSNWMNTFEHISTSMARTQNLPLNPFKLSGMCGRLKCCLAYEAEVYEALLEGFPKIDTIIQTAKGKARIDKIDVFKDVVYLYYEKSDHWERMSRRDVNRLIKDPKKENPVES